MCLLDQPVIRDRHLLLQQNRNKTRTECFRLGLRLEVHPISYANFLHNLDIGKAQRGSDSHDFS